jgi:hypothetical protein
VCKYIPRNRSAIIRAGNRQFGAASFSKKGGKKLGPAIHAPRYIIHLKPKGNVVPHRAVPSTALKITVRKKKIKCNDQSYCLKVLSNEN